MRLACRPVEEMLAAGVTESIGIRLLEQMTEIYAQAQRGHGIMPLTARDVDLWSGALFARLLRGRA